MKPEPLAVKTSINTNLHLELEPKPLATGHRRFSLVFTTPQGLLVRLDGWRVDKDALDLTPPVYIHKKSGNSYPLGAMSPQLKFQLLLLVKSAMDFEKDEIEKEQQEKEMKRHGASV